MQDNYRLHKKEMVKKSIAKNSFYNTIYQGFNVLFPLIFMTHFSQVLTASGIGKIEYARAIVAYFSMFASLGIPIYGVKIIAQTRNNIMLKSRAFWEMFYLNAFSTALCSIVYYMFISFNEYFNDRKSLFYIMGVLLVSNVANIDWYYQGVEDYSYITKRSIIMKIISFVFMIIFVKTSNDYILYAIIFCIASVSNYIFNIIYLEKQIKFISIKNCNIKRHLKPVTILLCSNIAIEIYTILDSVLLEYFHGEIYVGYYSNCVKIVRLAYSLSTAMVITFYPRISLYIKEKRNYDTNDLISKGCKISLIFAVPSTIGLFSTADSLIPVLFGGSFVPSIACLRILSVLVIIFSLATILGHTILIASGNEQRVLIATISGAILNTILNVLLIPRYKHNGAAIASVLAELLVMAILLTKTMKLIKISIEKSFLSSLLISLMIMTISIKVIDFWDISHLKRLILCIMLGITTYLGSLMFFRNTIILYFCSKLQKKLGDMLNKLVRQF